MLAVLGAAWSASAKADGWAFLAAAVGIGGTVGSIFNELYPRVMISSTNSAYNLTVSNSASPSYTLKVMTVVAVVLLPVVVAYQAWGYHVFKGRLSTPPVGGDDVVATDGATGDGAGARAEPAVPGPPAQAP